MTNRFRVIFDTDIGTDVDDALAFGVLLGSAEHLDLVATTTVYGDTLLRARLTRRYAELAGRGDLVTADRVHVGESATLSGREVWWAGHEGTLHDGLDDETVSDESAVDALVRTVVESPGEIDVIAVGPLTNIAAAIGRDARFAGAIRHLWIMGGAFDTGSGEVESEHNFRSDVVAASTVFAAGIPTTISALEITQRISMGADQLDRIAAAGEFGAALQRDIHQWWAFWNETWNVPHDPVTVLTMLRPELFTFSEPGTVSIAEDAEADGRSTFTPGAGSTRIVTDLDADAVSTAIVETVIAAQA